jgi:DNA repair protein RecO (recombination protein O)
MALVQDRCICLRKVEYSETSQILTLFAREHGLLRVIAKGAHRRTKVGASKFGGGLDLLDVGDAVFSHAPERDLPPLTEWTLCDGLLELRGNLRAIYLGSYAAELVLSLIEEHDPHPALFDRLLAVLGDLSTPRLEQGFLAFELGLLRETGYAPHLQSCVACGGKLDERERTFISPTRGGAICRNCEGATPDRNEIDPRLLRLACNLLRMERLPQLTRHQTDPLNQMLARHIEHALSRRLRMPQYILNGRAKHVSEIKRG